jgi:hypothetical protein
MGTCIKCGGSLGDFDVGGDMICDSCEARGSGGAGGQQNVPCQRCGMYLPSHELQMWNSRLYCAYCIMDVKDEEKRGKDAHTMHADSHLHGAGEGGVMRKYGTCQRCGKSTDELYTSQGMSLCAGCYHAYGAPGAGEGKPSHFGQAVTYIKQKLKLIVLAPKAILTDPRPQNKDEQTFDLRGRKMKEKEGQPEECGPGKKETGAQHHEGKKGDTHSRMHDSGTSPKEAAEHSKQDFSQFKGKTDPKK